MSVSLKIDADAVSEFFKTWGDEAPNRAASALLEAGRIVEADARRYAPHGPTKSQAASAPLYRYDSDKSPGTLERSIIILNRSTIRQQQKVEVGVPRNSPSNRYADYIHNRRNKTPRGWRFLGPGSTAKGGKVGDKFLDRALDDNAGDIKNLFEDAADF